MAHVLSSWLKEYAIYLAGEVMELAGKGILLFPIAGTRQVRSKQMLRG